jgi:hypothetical protein
VSGWAPCVSDTWQPLVWLYAVTWLSYGMSNAHISELMHAFVVQGDVMNTWF